MKSILFLLIFYASNKVNADSCKEKYTDFVLQKGFAIHSYYLNIYVKDENDQVIEVVVTSYDFYAILKKEQGLEKEQYIKVVKSSILEKKPVTLLGTFDSYNLQTFLVCKDDQEVLDVADHGKDYFIKYFFEKNSSHKSSGKGKMNLAAIIKQLIVWNIPVKLGDDEGGFYPDQVFFQCGE